MDFQKLVDENEEQIKKAALTAIEEKIKNHIEWRMPDVISGEVAKWFDEHVAPEVVKLLDDKKAGILAGIAKHMEEFTDEIGKTVFAEAKERLTHSWKRAEVMKALFGR